MAGRYGITVTDIRVMQDKQRNRCAICGIEAHRIEHKTFSLNPLVVDHCHTTGKVRGLLCPNCNHLLGHAKDSVATLRNAIQYLSQ